GQSCLILGGIRSHCTLRSRRFCGLPNAASHHSLLTTHSFLITTSPAPQLPAALRTRSTRTCVPARKASVLKRNDSDFESNRPSVGNTLVQRLPSTAKDASVSRTNGSVALASMTAAPFSKPTTFTVTFGGRCVTGTALLMRSAVSASS